MQKIIVFLKSKTGKNISLILLGIFIGILGAPMCSESSHDDLIIQNEEITAKLEGVNSEMIVLNDKLEEAKPFFEMSKEEQLKLEADAKAAEEKRIADEKKKEEQKKKEELEAKTKTFSNGNYVSGEDFEPGNYDIIAIKGGGNVSSSNVFSGGINAIMGIANDGFYEKEYKNIKLPEGVELKIDGVTVKLVPKQ